MANYESTVKLPSKGYIYEGIPEELTIRAMTVKEEKLMFGSTGKDTINRVLENCIITEGVDPRDLILGDKLYLLFELRILSYGPEYYVYGQCPECGQVHEFKIDLSEVESIELDEEEYNKYIEFTLPRTGKKIRCKLTTDATRKVYMDEVDRKLRMLKRNDSVDIDYDGMVWEYSQAYQIDQVDGKKLKNSEKTKFYEELPVMDTAYIRDRLSHITVGLDTNKEVTCPNCDQEYETNITMGPEFFRPRFD